MFSYSKLFINETFVITLCSILYAVIIGIICLDYHSACFPSPACPSGNLGYELECPLGRFVIRKVQRQIRSDNSHQGHIFEVMPFCNHLGSYENIRFVVFKLVVYPFV